VSAYSDAKKQLTAAVTIALLFIMIGIRFMGYSRGGYEAKEREAKVSFVRFNASACVLKCSVSHQTLAK
jgi:hypothetical protein